MIILGTAAPRAILGACGSYCGEDQVRTFTIAAIIVGLAMPAYAQFGGAGGATGGKPPGYKSPEQKAAEEKQEEKAYKDSLKVVPKSDQKVDPWSKMR